MMLNSLLKRWHTCICAGFVMCVVANPLSAQESASPMMESDATGSIDWVSEILKGGFLSIIILVVAFLALVFLIERLIVVRRKKFLPPGLLEELEPIALRQHFHDLVGKAESSPSTLGKLAVYIGSHYHLPFEILTIGSADIIARMSSRQLQRTYPLAVIATVSPLLGLLGTIVGMIESFQKVALMGDTGDASVLADSIGKALITTALGLMVAIPSLAGYHFFKSRINHFSIQLEEATDRLLAPWLHPEDVQAKAGDGEAEG